VFACPPVGFEGNDLPFLAGPRNDPFRTILPITVQDYRNWQAGGIGTEESSRQKSPALID